LSNSLCDATSELADRAKFQGRLVGDDRARSQARLSVSAFIRCALRGAWLLHFGLPFVIVRVHRLSLPNTSVELDVKLFKFGALFSQHLKTLWFAVRSANNLRSGVLGGFDRYCRVGLIFAGAVQTMTNRKCFSVAFKLGHFDFRRFQRYSNSMTTPCHRNGRRTGVFATFSRTASSPPCR
jgi:hypothetical protein